MPPGAIWIVSVPVTENCRTRHVPATSRIVPVLSSDVAAAWNADESSVTPSHLAPNVVTAVVRAGAPFGVTMMLDVRRCDDASDCVDCSGAGVIPDGCDDEHATRTATKKIRMQAAAQYRANADFITHTSP